MKLLNKLLCLASLLFCFSNITIAGKIVDLLSGEEVSMAELERTKNLGFSVISSGDTRESLHGLQINDRILAADGFRFFGVGELDLILTCTTQKLDTVHLLICRNGQLQECDATSLTDDDYPRQCVFRRLQPYEFTRVTDQIGLKLSKRERESLRFFSPRATVLLEKWIAENPSGRSDLGWLKDFVSLYTQMVNMEYSSVVAPKKQSPIEFYNRLSRFYLSIAEQNKVMEKTPDWKSHGESATFYVACYPFPRTVLPELGKIETSDPDFNRLMKALIDDPCGSMQQRRSAYSKYIKANTQETLASYLNHMKAMLVCGNHNFPEETWTLFLKSYGYQKPKIQSLLESSVPSENDRILYCVGKLILTHDLFGQIKAMSDICRISPYMAVYAQEYLRGSIRSVSTSDAPDLPIRWYKENGLQLDFMGKPCVFYEWLRTKKWEKLEPQQARWPLVGVDNTGLLYGPDGYFTLNPSAIRNALGAFVSPSEKLRAGIMKNDRNMVEEGLKDGADVKSASGKFKNALELATWSEDVDVDIVKCLVEHGANPTENKPLLYAAWRGKLGTVVYLVEKGADVNARDDIETVLINAAACSFEIAKLLIEKGADVNLRTEYSTALIAAAEHGQLETVKLLLAKGADVNAQDKGGRTALYWASSSKSAPECVEVVKLLLEKGAKLMPK
ncbi:MAG: hypothetical protein A2283_02810 [Lentisphaerae bacterium RIFOXYA12_FULL_48_11]|nr:MAG: hypothetical protein A2283_02810 [Lentisphaerae bacterium RIFOXYA12_FULL_48_11]